MAQNTFALLLENKILMSSTPHQTLRLAYSTRSAFVSLWAEHPLIWILLLALILRLVAVVFSRGYGMHDDHFLIIEIPWTFLREGRSWFHDVQKESKLYMTLHYWLLGALERGGLFDPDAKMFIVRLLHALYSLTSVALGYAIAEFLAGRKAAKQAGIMLAAFWLLPFMSVRNLVEMVCVPPLMAALYLALRVAEQGRSPYHRLQMLPVLAIGACLALAFALRYQTALVAAGLGVVLLWRREWRVFALMCGGFVLTAFATQGALDLAIHGYPFADFVEYTRYNAAHGNDYTTGPWYQYVLLMLGLLVPPTSLLLLYGAVRLWRPDGILLVPLAVYFVFHSIFPNKQERFILPIVTLVLVLCAVGYEQVLKLLAWTRSRPRVLKGLMGWFWAINTVLLVLFTTHYSKRTRIETLRFLASAPNVRAVLIGGGRFGVPDMPMFYARSQMRSQMRSPLLLYIYTADDSTQTQRVRTELAAATPAQQPNYAVLLGDDRLYEREHEAAELTHTRLRLVQTVLPSLLDDVLYRLNPAGNINQTAYIYALEPPAR
jgi:4-amino-4-deoxy-L-arabinose transferase-like glycosyltransferase